MASKPLAASVTVQPAFCSVRRSISRSLGIVVHDQHLSRAVAADMPADHAHQHLAIQRVGDVVGCSECEAKVRVAHHPHQDHWDFAQVRVGLERLQHRPAVQVRHDDVERDHIGPYLLRELKALAAPGGM